MGRLTAAGVALVFSAGVAFAAGPNVVVTETPKGMLQISGGPTASDSFTIANVGDANAVLSFQRSGSFFTISAPATALAPGAAQSVTINGTTQSASAILVGAVTITGSGVPQSGLSVAVRLMVAPAPVTRPALVAPEIPSGSAQPGGAGFIVAAGNQQVSSTAFFRNSGDGPVLAMAVGSTSWLVPQTDFVNINPFSSGRATFTIDPSKRPDAPVPLGGVEGMLSLRYLSGSSSSSASITIVSVVRPDVAAGEPAPLAPGELALFIPELAYRNRVYGDLFLAARLGDPAITDLRLYYARAVAGSSSLLAQIAQPGGSLATWFPSIVASLFGRTDQVGSVQIRGLTANVSIAAVQIADPGDGRVFYAALPVLRSDRAAATGETLLLTGVERSDTFSTTLYLQEMSGTVTSVQSDFFDAAGVTVGMRRVDTVGAFRALELLDVVPAGARSIRITNLGAGKIGAMAVLSDSATDAAWPLVDTSRSAPPGTGTWVIPVVVPPLVSAQMDIFVTNESSSSVPVTLENFTVPPVARRRAVHADALGSITLRPLETQRTSITPTTGLLRLSAPTGTITAAGRLTMRASDRVGSFGASLPIVPLANALGAQQGTRFTGVDDVPSRVGSSLILAEVGGATATVQVTLRYTFVAGQAVSSQAVSTKSFTVAPGQMMVIPSIAATVIGSLRDTIGDLRNMQLDVNVTGGAGRILPFIESIDANSGSVVVRSE